jgi:hypothetical protein
VERRAAIARHNTCLLVHEGGGGCRHRGSYIHSGRNRTCPFPTALMSSIAKEREREGACVTARRDEGGYCRHRVAERVCARLTVRRDGTQLEGRVRPGCNIPPSSNVAIQLQLHPGEELDRTEQEGVPDRQHHSPLVRCARGNCRLHCHCVLCGIVSDRIERREGDIAHLSRRW